ncbi:ParB/RepB/Spo0J family partition protein [Solemya velum gill symbiont]|uniref:Probable chromosome-partitioning protein ParB n=1 Tax=Solemya velum gill symbiont TaxID=2340 RepID=A0A0B0H8K8_SOVGS|nr:ParB/RepB/Spo0J family partition protein [Solemya velum gill symbiont]KHF26513.1 chromosome segregation DNA-binding protein [Solemya velum gill symbiont]OOY38619.1 chromosome partitioning protein ParB [Solemya velum gill symbiont]OOY39581.1 chromosome partitioning protein ParB [Solemya velum gill symbiont]OOY45245.1 chromosome partitioning protein ParB [Solemya velum gill symbiont]OOY48996.1 chromosome partitioning protein ParB [Solemya velum gill symbiont]
MTKSRGLGRGLDALLSSASKASEKVAETDSSDQQESTAAVTGDSISQLGVDLVQRGRYQPRRNFDKEKLQELADSISEQGIVQPIVVRPIGEGKYEIIAGERRWRAAQLAGLSEVPVVVRDVDDKSAMAMALIENIQRDDLNPLEEADALQRLISEFGLTHQQIAQAVGKSRTAVTNYIRLLDLESEVKRMVDEKKLEMGHARAILGLKNGQQVEAANKVVRQGLSVRETERLVRRMQGEDESRPAKPEPVADPNILTLERDLTEKLGASVKVKSGPKGKGKLEISYNSLDELEGIIEHIQ